MCRPIDKYSLKEQFQPNQNRSFLWSLGAIQLAKDQIPKDPLGFGLWEDQTTKTKPKLALSQALMFSLYRKFVTVTRFTYSTTALVLLVELFDPNPPLYVSWLYEVYLLQVVAIVKLFFYL